MGRERDVVGGEGGRDVVGGEGGDVVGGEGRDVVGGEGEERGWWLGLLHLGLAMCCCVCRLSQSPWWVPMREVLALSSGRSSVTVTFSRAQQEAILQRNGTSASRILRMALVMAASAPTMSNSIASSSSWITSTRNSCQRGEECA